MHSTNPLPVARPLPHGVGPDPAQPPPAAHQPPRPDGESRRSIDARLLERLARYVGAAPVEFALGDRARALMPGSRATGRRPSQPGRTMLHACPVRPRSA